MHLHASTLSSRATILPSNLLLFFPIWSSCFYKRNPSHISSEVSEKKCYWSGAGLLAFLNPFCHYCRYRNKDSFHRSHRFNLHNAHFLSTTYSITSLYNTPPLFINFQTFIWRIQALNFFQKSWLLTINFHQCFFSLSFDLNKVLP